jgi:hypothetical protein
MQNREIQPPPHYGDGLVVVPQLFVGYPQIQIDFLVPGVLCQGAFQQGGGFRGLVPHEQFLSALKKGLPGQGAGENSVYQNETDTKSAALLQNASP